MLEGNKDFINKTMHTFSREILVKVGKLQNLTSTNIWQGWVRSFHYTSIPTSIECNDVNLSYNKWL